MWTYIRIRPSFVFCWMYCVYSCLITPITLQFPYEYKWKVHSQIFIRKSKRTYIFVFLLNESWQQKHVEWRDSPSPLKKTASNVDLSENYRLFLCLSYVLIYSASVQVFKIYWKPNSPWKTWETWQWLGKKTPWFIYHGLHGCLYSSLNW